MPIPKPNKDGYYKKTLTVGKKPDGSPLQDVIRSKSYTEFKQLVRDAENRRDHGYAFDTKNLTVKGYGEIWRVTYKKPAVRDHCYETYEINLRLHIYPDIGHMKMTDVKHFHLQTILNKCEGGSTSQAIKIKYTLEQMFQHAKIDGVVIEDVSLGLVMPETVEGERRPLTDDEDKAVLTVAETHRAGLWILTMRYAGLRPEETVPLMWSDINLAPGSEAITVRRAVEWIQGRGKIKVLKGKDKKKGKEKERTIPIPPALADRLRAAPRRGLYVFTPEQSSGMLTLTNTRRLWRSFRREVDILMGAELYRNAIKIHAFDEEVTPYYLRHTYCTALFEIDIGLKDAQYLMGHADIRTTTAIYMHFTQRRLKQTGAIIREKMGAGQTVDKKETGSE